MLISIKQWLSLTLLAAGLAIMFTATAGEDPEISRISAPELNQLIREGDAPVIVDVRSSGEYQAGHIPGAIHIPFWAAWFRSDEISTPKDEPVIVYCAHGPRAGIGKFALTQRGFTQVRYLEGHMTAWYKAGLPVEPVGQ